MHILSSIAGPLLLGSVIAMSAGESGAATSTQSRSCRQTRDSTAIRRVNDTSVSVYCSKHGTLRLIYSSKTGKISLTDSEGTTVLENIHHRYDPQMVGGEQYIRFLPRNLQIYERRDLLMYLSAERSSGGNGGGQCGSGVEVYLNVMNIITHKRRGRVLIHSCNEGLELERGEGSSPDELRLEVVNDRLALKYMYHRAISDSVTGYLSQNFRKIELPDNVAGAAPDDVAKNPAIN